MLSKLVSVYNIFHCKNADSVVPVLVNIYNQNMGEIDRVDQIMYYYVSERKVSLWTSKGVLIMALVLLPYLHEESDLLLVNWKRTLSSVLIIRI